MNTHPRASSLARRSGRLSDPTGSRPVNLRSVRRTRPPEPIVVGNEAWIALTKGYYAIVEVRDLEKVRHHIWCALETKRPDGTIRAVYAKTGAGKYMHHWLVEHQAGMEIDHVDGNGLNNTRQNLRRVSVSQNQHNRRIQINNTTGFAGIRREKRCRTWLAYITIDGHEHRIGRFESVHEAAAARAAVELALFGDCA